MNKEQIIDEVFKSWIESKKCYRIVMNIYVEPKFKILSVDEVTFDDFPYVNSDGFYGFEKDGVEEFWFDFSKFKGDYPKLIKILKSGFITKIKTDNEFSERWGLKIEERELSENERYKIFDERGYEFRMNNWSKEEQYDKANIPTKLITLEYNQEKIYIYE